MSKAATAIAVAEQLALPAMKVLASLNLLFLLSFIIVFATALGR